MVGSGITSSTTKICTHRAQRWTVLRCPAVVIRFAAVHPFRTDAGVIGNSLTGSTTGRCTGPAWKGTVLVRAAIVIRLAAADIAVRVSGFIPFRPTVIVRNHAYRVAGLTGRYVQRCAGAPVSASIQRTRSVWKIEVNTNVIPSIRHSRKGNGSHVAAGWRTCAYTDTAAAVALLCAVSERRQEE